MTVISSS